MTAIRLIRPLAQYSHVPVVACRLVGVRTRGRTDATRERVSLVILRGEIVRRDTEPAAGGETGESRPKRETRLKATT